MKFIPKFLLILFCLCQTTFKVEAQVREFRLGFITGAGLTSMRSSEFERWRSSYSYSGGLFFQYRLKPKMAIELDISYENKSYLANVKLYDNVGINVGSANQRNNFNSISLPLMASWNSTGKTRIICNTGLYLNYLANYNTFLPDYTGKKTKTKEKIDTQRRFDLGLIFGLGLSRQLSERTSLQMEFRNYFGLKNMKTAPSSENYYFNSHTFLISLNFKLGKIEMPKSP